MKLVLMMLFVNDEFSIWSWIYPWVSLFDYLDLIKSRHDIQSMIIVLVVFVDDLVIVGLVLDWLLVWLMF